MSILLLEKEPQKLRKGYSLDIGNYCCIIKRKKQRVFTFIEMKSRFYPVLPMKDRNKDSMLETIS